jgi:hypothetical protein
MTATITRTLQPRQETATLRTIRAVLLAAAAVLLPAVSAVAQTNTGNVYGTVIDELGSPIPGGTASLTGAVAPRTATVGPGGLFRFLKVPPGGYTVTLATPGFATARREGVLVLVGRNVQVDFALKLATVEESVTVSSGAPLIDARKVETGQTFTGEQLSQIPTARDVWALIQQVPGVYLDTVNVAGNASASAPNLTSKGSGNVVYQVDGATITDNQYGQPFMRQNGSTGTYFDFSTFENVEVATGGSMLEQQTSGVTINVVTKRGTNQLKGSARYLYAAANWQSTNTPQEALDQRVQTTSTRYIREYGGDLGGPILKDRLWLWGAGSRQDISVNPATYAVGEVPYPQTVILEPWSAKLNAQISNSNSAAFYFLRSKRAEYGGGASPSRPPETRGNLLIPTDFYKAEDSNVFSPDLFGSAFASYQNADFSALPVGGLDRDIQYYDFSYHNTFYYDLAREPQRQVALEVSRFFKTGAVSHELKFRFNYRQQSVDSMSGLPGSQNQSGLEDSGGQSLVLLSRGVHKYFKAQYWTGTLGDTVTAGNLTLAAGIRYDLQQVKNGPSTSFGNALFGSPCTDCGADGGSFPGLPEVKYHGAPDWQFRYTNWQPRISATYALGEKKSTLLRASYARFADQLGYLGYYGSGTPVINGYIYGWTDLNGDRIVQPNEVLFNEQFGYYGVDPATLPNNPNQIQPGFRTPTTDEVTAGVDQQLGPDFAVSGTLSYRNTTNLQEKVPAGSSLATYELGGRAVGTASASNGFTIAIDEPYYNLTLPVPPPGVLLENRPGASQKYYGADLSVVKRLSGDWMLRANFGWNSFKQYLTPASIQNPNNLWRSGQNDNGGLAGGDNDNRVDAFLNGSWQFNVNGFYQGPWGLSFGVNFFGRQGYPSPYTVGVDTGNPVTGGLNLLIDRVDTYRYANVYELDFRLQKALQIGPINVIAAGELFNVANANTVLERYQSAGTYYAPDGSFTKDPSFNQIMQVQSPRIVRLSLQVNF